MAKDYYQILGVDKKASKDEIKKAFRTMAHQHHPDKKGGDAARFKEASEAYSVLSDNQKRAQYDQYGSEGPGFGGGGGAGFGGFDFSQFTNAQGGFSGMDFGDIFSDFFGGGQSSRTPRGRDISVDIELSFSESIFGVERKVRITKTSSCGTCKGSGGKPGTEMKTCDTCKGNGKIREMKRSLLGSFQTTRTCDTCHGNGKVPKEKCPTCKGAGVARAEEEISLAVPAGIEEGEMLRMNGRGEAISGGTPGDLYIKIHIKRDARWKKEGHNLVTDLKIKLSDALLGAEYPIQTLDGEIKLKIPAGIAFGEVLRVKGKGVPVDKSRRGDMLIRLQIELPAKLSKEAQKAVETLRKEGN